MQRLFTRITAIGNKYRFLKDNFLFRSVRPCYIKLKVITNKKVLTPDEQAIAFYASNAERVNAVANMLADERSQKEYLGMIKFRQTRAKDDYPILYCKDTQYFIGEMKPCRDEVFIDCGAFTGDTIYYFLRYNPDYKRIVAFEPDTKNFDILQKEYGKNPNITLINAGVYDKDGEVSFSNIGYYTSRIVDEGDNDNCIRMPVKAIDNLNLEKVSFIKMDIEGAELNALKGAEKTILRNKPKLAICIYHSDEDMIRIAEYVRGLVPEYKLYVRHHYHYPCPGETVLYAVMP